MKNGNVQKKQLIAVPVLGLAANVLRALLYRVAVDEKNLLVPGHPVEMALWAVVLAAAALVVLTVRKMGGSGNYADNFGPSARAATGNLVMGIILLGMVLTGRPGVAQGMGKAWRLLGLVASLGFVWSAWLRWKGRKPFFLARVAACLFLLLHIVTYYQHWSGNPQLQDYIFDLLAVVLLTLFSYHTALFEVGMGKRRMQLATGLLACLLCLTALSGSEYFALCLGGAYWSVSDLCALEPKEGGESHEDS